jgi:hypothetical protein
LGEADQCLIGHWNLSDAETAKAFQDSAEPGAMEDVITKGYVGARFEAGGKNIFFFEGLKAFMQPSSLPNDIMGFVMHGTITTHWSTAPGGRLSLCHEASDAEFAFAMAGVEASPADAKKVADLVALSGTKGQEYTYTFQDDILTLQDPTQQFSYKLVLPRDKSAPP